MTYPEALAAMRAGHATRRATWDDGQPTPEFLFIRPEWEMNVHDLPIIKSIPASVKRLIHADTLPLDARLVLSETLCHYDGLHVVNGFIPTVADKNATDWRRIYPAKEIATP